MKRIDIDLRWIELYLNKGHIRRYHKPYSKMSNKMELIALNFKSKVQSEIREPVYKSRAFRMARQMGDPYKFLFMIEPMIQEFDFTRRNRDQLRSLIDEEN